MVIIIIYAPSHTESENNHTESHRVRILSQRVTDSS